MHNAAQCNSALKTRAMLMGMAFAWLACLTLSLLPGPLQSQALAEELAQGGVAINGRALSPNEVAALSSRLGPIQPGRYWYDARAGIWGYAGGPMVGHLPPGLPLGAMPPHISYRGTNVYVNGRELHPLEVRLLMDLYGSVIPGRYWLDANGVGGFEGGPAIYNLHRQIQTRYGRSSGSVYSPGIGGRPGIGVGRASDGCVYISYGGYSNESC